MRKAAPWLLAIALLVACISPAVATIYGTLTIKQIQDPGTAPNPVGVPNPAGSAAGDTVGPVYGIITCFDTFPSGFAFYLQNNPGGPWTGIDVFTGGANTASTLGLQVRDSVAVTGALAEFSTGSAPCNPADGGTEIIAKNGSFGTDLTITKISSGRPLPPFHIGTAAELKELCTNANAEQWEGCLVRLNGPLKIGRTNFTGGLGTFRSALVTLSSCAGPVCDSVFIDLSTLANPAVDPGTVGQTIDFVQGAYDQRARCYRIQIRDGNDYGIQAPPNVARGYAIGPQKYRIERDRDVTQASAEDESNYTIASIAGPPNLATLEADGSHIDLDVTTPLTPGGTETVSVTGLVGLSSNLPMTTLQNASFHAGILTAAQVQAPNPDSLSATPCSDVSKLGDGLPVTISAICTAQFGTSYYLSSSNSQRDGITVFAPPADLNPGERYMIAGGVLEFFGETEMGGTGAQIVYVQDQGAAAIPAPVTQTIAVLNDATCDFPEPGFGTSTHQTTGEDFEGMLVHVNNVLCTEDRAAGQSFFVTTYPPSADTILVSLSTSVTFTFQAARTKVLNVTGILRFSDGTFRIAPRSDADIVQVTASPGNNIHGQVTFSAFPNPARTTRVAFGLPRRDDVELAVYDAQGRKVAVIAKGVYEPGSYTEEWNGRNSSGDLARAGMYFYRLRVGKEILNLRAVKLD